MQFLDGHSPSLMNSNLPYQTHVVYRSDAQSIREESDILAEETAIALIYNGISHVVLMATPTDLEALALGFSLTEGILQSPTELYEIDIIENCHGIEIQMKIASSRFHLLKERRRNMTGRTGCGLCGIDSLASIQPHLPQVTHQTKISADDIQTALSHFDQHQPLRQQVGSVHGVAWVEQGKIQYSFEDVGRHNALDKLLGHGSRLSTNWQNGFVLISSRASYEMVAKAASIGISCIVAVSAPTALAVRLAEQAQITLIGFAKPQKFTIYTHPQWIKTSK